MVAPIVGPITREIGGSGPDNQSYYSYQKMWRQARPFDQPLRYERSVGKVSVRVGSPPYGPRRFGVQGTIGNFDFTDLQNKSYDKLKGRIYDEAQMAVNLIEGRQSLQMIASRAGQLLRFSKRLRKLDFSGAARELRLSTVPKGVSTKKAFASNWLEYYFGWSPLIGDIYSAVDILQSPLKEQFASGSAFTKGGVVNLQTPYETENPRAFNNWCYRRFYETLQYTKAVSRQGVEVAVSNPNLFLANQLGLVNPATVIWEVIPFSFVVDWFVNVEQFLSSGTDFAGLTLQNAYNTRYLECRYEYYLFTRFRWWVEGTYHPNDRYYYTSTLNHIVTQGYHVVRNLGLATPILSVRPLKLPSWKRALTATSLLIQQLSRR